MSIVSTFQGIQQWFVQLDKLHTLQDTEATSCVDREEVMMVANVSRSDSSSGRAQAVSIALFMAARAILTR